VGGERTIQQGPRDPAEGSPKFKAATCRPCRLASPFTAREVYRQEWTGLTEPRVVLGALECLQEL